MPVSKKRKKKDGKPVKRAVSVAAGEEHPHGPEEAGARPAVRPGKPSNPFVAQQQGRRASQRGR